MLADASSQAPEAIVNVSAGVPYSLWFCNLLAVALLTWFLVRRGLRSVPGDLADAARIDGCGFWTFCRQVILPSVGPMLALSGAIVVFAAVDDILAPTLTGMNVFYSIVVPGHEFIVTPASLGYAMAGSLLLVAVVITLISFAGRYFRKSAPASIGI